MIQRQTSRMKKNSEQETFVRVKNKQRADVKELTTHYTVVYGHTYSDETKIRTFEGFNFVDFRPCF